MNVKENFFFRAQSEKGIAQHTSSMIWTLIDNGKLANQIMRLAAIVVKIDISWLKYTPDLLVIICLLDDH